MKRKITIFARLYNFAYFWKLYVTWINDFGVKITSKANLFLRVAKY